MNGRPVSVLLVEDDIDSAEELAELLESYGMTVTLAHTVGQALEKARQRQFAMALIDVGLGDESGLDIAEAWHGSGPYIVLLTGSAVAEEQMCRFADPAPPVLIKPIEVSQLLGLIERQQS
ncbi:DNA-binding response OmpR family regulator [Novosphingobium hassiacum]|uniref:DNA-binding response OmpR family regulator n=1 Tax=Novosphingobium hassiacum TaxID=173676 RepID=A0A7W6A289_9SPHN|nr:response regulator [Novosphingobium hassiacum]MBB3862732.1 DNA-binding response OmpR family regulator [Novosphingobium hassiacum]